MAMPASDRKFENHLGYQAWAHPGAPYQEARNHCARQRQKHAAHGQEQGVLVDPLDKKGSAKCIIPSNRQKESNIPRNIIIAYM